MQHAFRLLALFAVYFLTARLGLSFYAVGGVATTVWPPTGIALAALVLSGHYRLWPAIFAAAVLVNVSVGVAWLPALLIGAGNTLEAVIGAWLLKQARFNAAVDRLRDVLALVALAAIASTVVSASFGVGAVWLGGGAVELARLWRSWWLGDILGDLLVAPFLLVWLARGRPRLTAASVLEAVALVLSVGGAGFALFAWQRTTLHAHTYLVLPLIIWAAVRFGQRGALSAVLILDTIALYGAVRGLGPFARTSPADGLIALQAFLGVMAATSLTLGAAIDERQRAVRARDDFLAIATHELRNPLGTLKLSMHLLRKRGESPELTRVERQVDRLEQLADNLLDVSRLDAGRLVLERVHVDLTDLVRGVVTRLAEGLAASECTLEVEAAQPVYGFWDRLRVEQVVTNLLTNAIKHGGGRVTVAVSSDHGRARIAVTDTGAGIPPADQGRIFGRFERGSAKERAGGLGLGLFIVHEIVTAHGGTVSVRSAPGRGAIFTVELPDQPNQAG